MSYESTIQELELSARDAQAMVERSEKVRALIENPIFKEIVVDGYFTQEAARLVHLMSDPNIPEKARDMIVRDLNGPPAFNRYLQTQMQLGHQAQEALAQAREMIAELHTAEVAGEEFDG